MLIYIEDEIIEVENDKTKISDYLALVFKKLSSKNNELGYLIVDGEPVHQDAENYLADHVNDISKVEVVVDTTRNLIKDTINSTEQYLHNAIPQIQTLSEKFYASPDEKTWLTMIDLFEGIQWILETVIKIDGIKNLEDLVVNYSIWNEYVQSVADLNGIVPELQVAMENQDNVLIGDLLLYEIVPVFEKMSEKMIFLITKEGDNHVS